MNQSDFPNRTQKILLVEFWNKFDGKKTKGCGFPKHEKLKALRELSAVVIPYKTQIALSQRRESFDETKGSLHSFRRYGLCFGCSAKATSRHHIIQLQHGGINSKKNLVSLCDGCHAEIHPWLKLSAPPR